MGALLASGSEDKTVKLWDVQTQREVATLKGHGDSVTSVAFAPDGRLLASGGEDKTVKLWDVQTQREVATLKGTGTCSRPWRLPRMGAAGQREWGRHREAVGGADAA